MKRCARWHGRPACPKRRWCTRCLSGRAAASGRRSPRCRVSTTTARTPSARRWSGLSKPASIRFCCLEFRRTRMSWAPRPGTTTVRCSRQSARSRKTSRRSTASPTSACASIPLMGIAACWMPAPPSTTTRRWSCCARFPSPMCGRGRIWSRLPT